MESFNDLHTPCALCTNPPFAHVTLLQMKRRSPVKLVESRGDLVLCITLEVEAHVSITVPGCAAIPSSA